MSEDQTPFKPEKGEGKKKDGSQPPNAVGEQIMGSYRFMSDKHGAVYCYNGRCWVEFTEHSLSKLAFEADGPFFSNARRRREIVSFIRAKSHVGGEGDITWGRLGSHEIPCLNGVLDLTTMQMRPHRPEDLLEWTLPIPWNATAHSAAWEKALDDFFDEDLQRRDALQDFFGYIASPHARYKMALVLFGDGDTGKSVILHAARMLVGHKLTCALSCEAMDDPVQRAVLIGKALNVVSELPAEAMIKDGGFKQLVSTEEPITINQKYTAVLTYTPIAKHIISTNNLPRINDKTEATFNRILLIPMTRVFTEAEQDTELPARLSGQMAGVLRWAIEGAKRLYERNGAFVRPASSLSVMDEYREAANPIPQFLRERCVADPTAAVPTARMAKAFNAWHDGRKVSTRQFGDLCRKAKLVVKSARIDKDTTARCLFGYRLQHGDLPDDLIVAEDAASSSEEIVEASANGRAPGHYAKGGAGEKAPAPKGEGDYGGA